MPRLPNILLRNARRIDSLLQLVLRATRDIESARCELRWLREHAIRKTGELGARGSGLTWRRHLEKLCYKRSRGAPLQYLLGSEYFGDLEIKCKPGVLIPRYI